MPGTKTNKITLEMTKVKETKNFVAFAVPEDKRDGAAAQNLYVDKAQAAGATKCKVTLEMS